MKKTILALSLCLSALSVTHAQKGSIIFTHSEYSSYDAAKPHAITEVKDGETLWMYAKFDKPVHSFTEEKDAYGNTAYYLRLSIGAAGSSENWSEDAITFTKDKLSGNEIKLNLSPGLPDRTKANGIFVYTVGKGQPGVWTNSIRINTAQTPKIAEGTITANVSDGVARYKKIAGNFEYVLDGKTVFKEKPLREGRFKDAAMLNMVKDELKKKGYQPSKVYFNSDTWSETYDNNTSSTRHVVVVYLYKKGSDCMMGIAYVETKGNPQTKQYGKKAVRFVNEKMIDCD